jgi:lipoprotein signal peptidase
MSSTRRQACYLIGIVALDSVLKAIAYYSMVQPERIRDCILCVVVTVNLRNLGSAGQYVVSSQGLSSLAAAGAFSLVLAGFLAMIAATGRLTKWSVALCMLAAAGLVFAIARWLPTSAYSYEQIATFSRAANTGLWLVVWGVSPSSLWRFGALLFSAAGLSNSLSAVYPPHRVVDYLWSAPLNQLIGIGVFNFADICWLMAFPVFVAALLLGLIRKLSRRQRGCQPLT